MWPSQCIWSGNDRDMICITLSRVVNVNVYVQFQVTNWHPILLTFEFSDKQTMTFKKKTVISLSANKCDKNCPMFRYESVFNDPLSGNHPGVVVIYWTVAS